MNFVISSNEIPIATEEAVVVPSIFDSSEIDPSGVADGLASIRSAQSGDRADVNSRLTATRSAIPAAAQRIHAAIADTIGSLNGYEFRPKFRSDLTEFLQGGVSVQGDKFLGRTWTLGQMFGMGNVLLDESGRIFPGHVWTQERPSQPLSYRKTDPYGGPAKRRERYNSAVSAYESDPYWAARTAGVSDGELYWRVPASAVHARIDEKDGTLIVPLVYDGWRLAADFTLCSSGIAELEKLEGSDRSAYEFQFRSDAYPRIVPQFQPGFHYAVFEDARVVIVGYSPAGARRSERLSAHDLEKFLARRLHYVTEKIARGSSLN